MASEPGFSVMDQNNGDFAIQTRAGEDPERDLFFARGFVSGTVEIHSARVV